MLTASILVAAGKWLALLSAIAVALFGAVVQLPLLTASRARDYRACARLHHYKYELGFRPAVEAETARFGSLVHRALEAWWKAVDGARLDAALAALELEADPFDRARAEVMIAGYDARWSGQELDVLAVEVEFVRPLVNPATGAESRTWRHAGKLDAVARERSTGRVLVVEHKTTSEDLTPGSEYWQRLRLDAQVSGYMAGARALGFEPVACLYDVLGKPAIRPGKATPIESRKYTKAGALYAGQREADETAEEFRARLVEAVAANPERYFARGEVVRLEEEEAEAAFDLWQTGRAIREGQLARRHPRNPDACQRWGRTCEFFGPCTRTASLDDPTRFRRTVTVHEELTLPTAEGASA